MVSGGGEPAVPGSGGSDAAVGRRGVCGGPSTRERCGGSSAGGGSSGRAAPPRPRAAGTAVAARAGGDQERATAGSAACARGGGEEAGAAARVSRRAHPGSVARVRRARQTSRRPSDPRAGRLLIAGPACPRPGIYYEPRRRRRPKAATAGYVFEATAMERSASAALWYALRRWRVAAAARVAS